MTRAYLRLDPHLVDHKADYPDGAFRAFVECLCHADQQPDRGRFRNERLLKVLLERRARWVPFLIEHRDLILQADGRLYVDGWDDWQEGDITVPERMVRLRNRKRGVTPPDTAPVTPSVTEPVTAPRLAEAEASSTEATAEAHAPRARQKASHDAEPVGDILPRAIGNGDEPEIDAYVFAVRILGYAPRNDDFRAELVELETKFGMEKTVQAEQDVYRAFINEGRRPKPFDLIKDTRTLLMTGHHLHEKVQTAEEKAEAEAKRKANEERILADMKRQQDEEFRRRHPDWKGAA